MVTRNGRAALAFQSPHWLHDLGCTAHLNNEADNPEDGDENQKSHARKELPAHYRPFTRNAECWAHGLGGSQGCLWSMGLLQLSQDRCSFRSSGKQFGPQRAAQRFHSLTFHPAAFLTSGHSLSHGGGPVGSAHLSGRVPCPSPKPIPGRKSLHYGMPLFLTPPLPSWNETQAGFTAIFAVGQPWRSN